MNTSLPTVIAVLVAAFLIFTGVGINMDYVGESDTDIKADTSPDAKSNMNPDASPEAMSDIKPDAPTGGSKMPKQTVYSPAGMAAIGRESFRIAKEIVAARLLSRKKDTTAGSLAEVKPARASEATSLFQALSPHEQKEALLVPMRAVREDQPSITKTELLQKMKKRPEGAPKGVFGKAWTELQKENGAKFRAVSPSLLLSSPGAQEEEKGPKKEAQPTENKPAGASKATMASALSELESARSPDALTPQELQNLENLESQCNQFCWTMSPWKCTGDGDERLQCTDAEPGPTACAKLGADSRTCTCAKLKEEGHCETDVVGDSCDKTCGKCKYKDFCTKNCQLADEERWFPVRSLAPCRSKAKMEEEKEKASLDSVRAMLFQALSPEERKEALDTARALFVAQRGEISGAETEILRKDLIDTFKHLSTDEKEAALTHAVRAHWVSQPAIGPNMLLKTLKAEHPELAEFWRKGTEKIDEVLSSLKAQGADQEVAGSSSSASSSGDEAGLKKVGTSQPTHGSTKKGPKKQKRGASGAGGSLAEVKPARASEATMANARTELESDRSRAGPAGDFEAPVGSVLVDLTHPLLVELENKCYQCWAIYPYNCQQENKTCVDSEPDEFQSTCKKFEYEAGSCTCSKLKADDRCDQPEVKDACPKTCGKCEVFSCTNNCVKQLSSRYLPYCASKGREAASFKDALLAAVSQLYNAEPGLSPKTIAERLQKEQPLLGAEAKEVGEALEKLFQDLSPEKQVKALIEAVRVLFEAQPGLSPKKTAERLQEEQPWMQAGAKEVGEALKKLFKVLSPEGQNHALIYAVVEARVEMQVAEPYLTLEKIAERLQNEQPWLGASAGKIRKAFEAEGMLKYIKPLEANVGDNPDGVKVADGLPSSPQRALNPRWSEIVDEPEMVFDDGLQEWVDISGPVKNALFNAVRALSAAQPGIGLTELVDKLKEEHKLGAEPETVREALIDAFKDLSLEVQKETLLDSVRALCEAQPGIKTRQLVNILQDEHPQLAEMLKDPQMGGEVVRILLKKGETDRKALDDKSGGNQQGDVLPSSLSSPLPLDMEEDPAEEDAAEQKKRRTDEENHKKTDTKVYTQKLKTTVPRPTRGAKTDPKKTQPKRVGGHKREKRGAV